VSYLNTYRDGSLPAIQQEYHWTQPRILRCSYWVVAEWSHTNLSSPYWRLYWNREPGAYVLHGTKRYPLRPDCILLIAPHTPFQSQLGESPPAYERNILKGAPYQAKMAIAPGAHIHHLFVHFSLGQPCDSLQDAVFDFKVADAELDMLQALTDKLGVDRMHFNHHHSFLLQALLHDALCQVPDTAWPKRQLDARVLRVMHYIDSHYAQRLQNEDFGREANMSPNAFTRLFRNKTGMTPLAYLSQRRIEEASILLHHSDQSIEQIADACGFGDRYYFTRVFKKHFKVCPATYRKHRN